MTISRRTAVAGGVLGSAALVAGVTLAARAMGFGRWLAFSAAVGADCVGQAYLTANQLPNVLYEVAAGGAMAGAVVPLVAGAMARAGLAGGPERAPGDVDRIASALLTWAVAVLLPLSLLLALLAGPLIDLLLGTPTCPGQRDLAVTMLVVFAPQVVLYGVGAVLTGVLQAHRRFLWPAMAPLLSSVVVIASYLAFAATAQGAQDDAAGLPPEAVAWLAGGTTLGVVVMTVPLLVPVRSTGVRLRPALSFPPGVARRARALATAGIVALLAQQASVVVFILLANTQGTTSTITVFSYAQAVYLLPYAVLAVPLATTAFPRLSTRAAEDDAAGFADTAARTTRAVVVVAVLGSALVAATAPAVAAFFADIDQGSPTGMAQTLTAIAGGLVGFALVAHVGRALYALHRGRLAAGATAGGWLATSLAALVLAVAVPDSDDVVVALGLAMTLGMSLAGVLLLIALRSAAGAAALAQLRRTGAVALAGGLVGVVAGRLASDAALAAWGSTAGPAVAAAVVGAVTVLLFVAGVVWAGDRGVVTQIRDVAA